MTVRAPEFTRSEYFKATPMWHLEEGASDEHKQALEVFMNGGAYPALWNQRNPEMSSPHYTWNGEIIDLGNEDGGPGSGNHGHKGVPGQVGGSAPGDGTSYRGSSGEKCREYSDALSSKTKAQIAKQAAKDPEFKKLTDAISLYTQGGYAQQRQIAEKLVDGSFREEDDFTVGKFVQDNKFMVVKDLYKGQGLEESTSSTADGMAQLIGTINESKPYEGKLYRAAQDRNIIKVGGDYTPFVIPEVGQTIQLSAPTSFTTDKAVADKLMMQKMGDKIFYTIDEGASAVDVSKLSPYKQKEMLTCGTYEVVAVKKTEKKNFIVGGEQYATKAQKERGLVDNWGAPHYITYDVEIQLRQVGKVSIGRTDSKDEVLKMNDEHFEDRMILNSEDEQQNDGGPGSGNHGHEGRPGKVGGSSSSGHIEAVSITNHLEDYELRNLRHPGRSVTGGWGMKSTCKQYMRKEGASEETLNTVDRLFDGHKSGGDWQKDCDKKIFKHIADGDAIGKALISRSQFETGCYEEWKKAHPDSNQLNQNGELRVYRKGDRTGEVECWTIDPDGADMGHGGIGVDHESTLEQLQREGYSVIAGFGTMGGAPGEGEITFVKTGDGVNTDDEQNVDGGPGSGNWGHEGRPGKVGGSAEGGGSHNRMGNKKEGYTSFSKNKKKFATPHKSDWDEYDKCPDGSIVIDSYGIWEKKNSSTYVNKNTGEMKWTFQMADDNEDTEVRILVPDDKNPNFKKLKIRDDDRFSAKRKQAAFHTTEPQEADDIFREQSGKIWKEASDDAKNALYNYTGHYYSDINDCLRSGSKPTEKIGQYIQDMTETIEKSELQQDTFLYRGVDRWALSKMLGVDYTTLGKQNPGAYIGKEISDNAFMSCSSAEGMGFDTSGVYLKIYCPAGTKAIYAEPFSKYGNGAKRDWDGESRQTSFSKEFETILQRGTRMQITNMSRDEYGSYSVECQVLAQEYE